MQPFDYILMYVLVVALVSMFSKTQHRVQHLVDPKQTVSTKSRF